MPTKNTNRLSDKEYIKKFTKMHNNKFSYEEFAYNGYNKETIIFCTTHKENFTTTPYIHNRSKHGGCGKCKKEHFYKEIVLEENEIMKDVGIKKYTDLYAVTNFGRIFRKKTGREISKRISTGYHTVSVLDNNKKSICEYVHHIVYKTFNNDHCTKKVIDHIDRNKLNNRTDNLRCVSYSISSKNVKKNKKKAVLMFKKDDKNKLIKRFEDAQEASDYLKYKNKSSVQRCLTGMFKSVRGFCFKYENEKYNEQMRNANVTDLSGFVSLGKLIHIKTGNYRNFSIYSINKEGVVINTNNKNRKISHQSNGDGYKYVSIRCAENKQKTVVFLVHRLIGKFFLKDGNKYFDGGVYKVNHKDENKSNNSVSNLEWCTSKYNTTYSSGKKIAKLDINTGEVIEQYDSVSDGYRNNRKLCASITFFKVNVPRVCNGKGRTAYGFKWKWI